MDSMVTRSKWLRYASAFIVTVIAFSYFTRPATVAQQTWVLPTPWSAQDVGNPAIAGSATFDQGTFAIPAAGSDIGGKSDQFTFVYQRVTGDVDVIARVDAVSAADTWSNSGVMIRSSLASNAAHGFALVSAGRGVAFRRRASTGGQTNN